jgi:hypothetical protein
MNPNPRIVVNVDRGEFLHPHRFDNSQKLCELNGHLMMAVARLLAAQNRPDLPGEVRDHMLVGRWAGQHIVIVGEKDDPPDAEQPNLYQHMMAHGTNLSSSAVVMLTSDPFVARDIRHNWPAAEYEIERARKEHAALVESGYFSGKGPPSTEDGDDDFSL